MNPSTDHLINPHHRPFAQVFNDEIDAGLIAEAGPSAFAVLVCLRRYAGSKESCYPGRKRLASLTGLAPSTVSVALDRLITLGLVEKIERTNTNGGQVTNLYILHEWKSDTPFRIPEPPIPESGTKEDTGEEEPLSYESGRTAKKNDENDSAITPWDIWVWWNTKVGLVPERPDGKSMSAAKRLIEHTITTTAELDRLWDWMKADPWYAAKGIDLPLMNMAVLKWRAAEVTATSDVRSPGQGLWSRHGGRI